MIKRIEYNYRIKYIRFLINKIINLKFNEIMFYNNYFYKNENLKFFVFI